MGDRVPIIRHIKTSKGWLSGDRTSQPGQREIQAALLYDYRTKVASYPAWQA